MKPLSLFTTDDRGWLLDRALSFAEEAVGRELTDEEAGRVLRAVTRATTDEKPERLN